MSAERENWPEFLRLWENLRYESEQPRTVVLVEGERDRAALRNLGVRGPILLVHNGKPLSVLADHLSRDGRRVIILTDWDREGGHLAHRLADLFSGAQIHLDLEFRRRLARILQGEVVHVEGLGRWARRVAEEQGAPLDHWLTPAFR
jgi:5S rRNA maturation endonuclease (ribonuclease M5)